MHVTEPTKDRHAEPLPYRHPSSVMQTSPLSWGFGTPVGGWLGKHCAVGLGHELVSVAEVPHSPAVDGYVSTPHPCRPPSPSPRSRSTARTSPPPESRNWPTRSTPDPADRKALAVGATMAWRSVTPDGAACTPSSPPPKPWKAAAQAGDELWPTARLQQDTTLVRLLSGAVTRAADRDGWASVTPTGSAKSTTPSSPRHTDTRA